MIMFGIDGDCEEDEIAACPVLKTLFDARQVVGEPEAVVGIWTTRVSKGQGDHLALKLRQPNRLRGLIRQLKVRNELANSYYVYCCSGIERIVQSGQLSGLQRF